ncbi:MAG: hypothetical protein GEV28_40805 [Actinophytocola sp.]|uniref:hypothetical protein n=1 Tax=Actinophytocola sp. TaxID=1872138 RepID=UPI00132B8C7C|nr:hypothetical protein [Actinophytocola sp.]MPZ86376.1 hypothetical protein [Actinophytocola sp.]
MRVLLTVGLIVAVATACSSADRGCTAIGSPAGIGVEVDPAVAPKISGGTLKLCWEGGCRTGRLELRPSTAAAESTCDGEVCSAHMRETGGKRAFMEAPDLPETELTATLRLTDRSGANVVDQTLGVTPEPTYPNGPGCGAGGPQQQLLVDANRVARVR